MDRRDKRTLKKRHAARAAKRRTLAEVERLAVRGDARAKKELRDFVRSCEQLWRTATAEFQRLQAELDASIKHAKATMSPAEILEKLPKKRGPGRPRDEVWIEKLAQSAVNGNQPSLRALAKDFRPDLDPEKAYDELRKFKDRAGNKKAIAARIAELTP